MATLKQNPTSFAKYLIFFGECNSNSELFDLTTTDTVLRATEYTEDGTGIASYDSNVTFSFLQDFTELKSGHIYEVMLKKGDSELVIDGVFHSFNSLTTSAKVTSECGSVNNPTPTPEQTPTPTPTPVQPTPTPTPVQPTPTPTPVAPIVCCDGKTIVTAGNDDKGVSLVSEAVAGGTLCFESTDTTPGANKTFHCKYENEAFACSVSLDLEQGLDAIKDKIFRYELDGNCFEADFTGFNDQDFGPIMKLISSSPTTTPTPIHSGCCAGKDQSMIVTEDAESVNQLTVDGTRGTLCWNSTTGFSSPKTYNVSFNDDSYSLGGLKIVSTGNLQDDTFVFVTETNECYEGKLENPAPFITVFNIKSDETPTPVNNPTPSPTPTPTPEPISLSGCCEGMDFSVNIVNGVAEQSLVNQISANGEDGTLCWKALTGFASNKSYTNSLGDASFADGGVGVNVTGVFSDTKFRFVRSSTGVCYEGRLETEAPTANVFLPVSEDATPTPVSEPTPTPTETTVSTPECCDGLTTITKGQDSAGVSFPTEGVDGGTLCFESLNFTPGANKAFHCMYPDNTFAFTVAFDLQNGQNAIKDSTIRYEINDKCYMVDLRGVADQAVVTIQELNLSSSEDTSAESVSSTETQSESFIGDTLIEVTEQSKFQINEIIVIDPNTNIEEFNEIMGFGSLKLKYPLKYNHGIGAIVQKVNQSPASLAQCSGALGLSCFEPFPDLPSFLQEPNETTISSINQNETLKENFNANFKNFEIGVKVASDLLNAWGPIYNQGTWDNTQIGELTLLYPNGATVGKITSPGWHFKNYHQLENRFPDNPTDFQEMHLDGGNIYFTKDSVCYKGARISGGLDSRTSVDQPQVAGETPNKVVIMLEEFCKTS